MKHILTLCLIITLVFITGCARRISQNHYSAASVGEASHSYRGVIISSRKVQVGAESLGDNKTGTMVGALAGGVGGSQIGAGNGSILAAAGGAVIGGIAGAFIEDELVKQTGMEYSVELDNGQIVTVVQGDEETYAIGQRVLVLVSAQGRSRIIPDNSLRNPKAKKKKDFYVKQAKVSVIKTK